MTAGSVNILLTADTSNVLAKMVEAGTVTEREAKRMQKSLQFVSDQLKVLNQAQKAANESGAATAKSAANMEHFGFASASAKRELLVLAHELSQGNYSRFGGSLMVLAERTNAMELAFSAAGLAAGVLAIAVGGVLTGVIAGHLESDRFAKSLVATGNAAGMTADSFEALARSAANATGSTIGGSRGTLQDLVSTGRLYPEVIGVATQASLNLQRVTGQTSEAFAGEFAKMADGVAKWAADYNRHAHFVTQAEFERIKALEDAGKKEEAARKVMELLNAQLASQETNLGSVERAWKSLTKAISDGVDAVKSIGRAASPGEELESLRKRLAAAQSGVPGDRYFDAAGNEVASKSAAVASIQARIDQLRELMRFQGQAARNAATLAAQAERGIDAIMNPAKSALDPKAYANFIAEVQKANEQASLMLGTGRKLTEAERWELEVKKRLTEQWDKMTDAERMGAAWAVSLTADRLKLASATEKARQQEESFQAWFGKSQADEAARNAPMGQAVDEAMGRYLRGIGDNTKRAESIVSQSMQHMEDAIISFVKTGKLGFSDLFSSMAEDFLRNEIRMAEKKFLLDDAGNFIGFEKIFAGIGGMFSGWFGHANGLDYVPYDGYPALLHEGERVQTKLEASGGRAGGGTVHFDFSGQVLNVGQGVSRGEVAAALGAQRSMIMADIRRQTSTRGYV